MSQDKPTSELFKDAVAFDEFWLEIPGYPKYRVSNLGRIEGPGGNHHGARKILSCRPDNRGYVQVRLSRNGKYEAKKVHQLVCAAFNGPRPSLKHETRHLNGISYDNRAENLRWGTRAENIEDKVRHGTDTYASTKSHCVNGHEFTEENTYRYIKEGYQARQCRACGRNRSSSRWRAKQKAKALASLRAALIKEGK